MFSYYLFNLVGEDNGKQKYGKYRNNENGLWKTKFI